MNVYKKITALLLVLTLLCPLAACTGTMTPTPTADNKTTETKAETTTAQPTETTQAPTAEPTPAPTETAQPTESKTEVQPTETTPAPTETTPTPTETPVVPVEELKKPEINEKFTKADGTPEEVRFFVNSGDDEEWYDTLCTRSIAILFDGDKGPDPDYVVNAETIRRNNTVEEELGVKIYVKDHGSMRGTVDILKPILMAGNDEYDIMALYSFFDMDLAVADTIGSFINYENMPKGVTSYIDPNNLSPWWNKQIYDATRLTNPKHMDTPVNFFITGDISQTLTGNVPVTFVNKTMWDRYADRIAGLGHSGGYGDIDKIVENGYWTMDLLIELIALCYEQGAENPDGRPDGDCDQVGLLTDEHRYLSDLSMTVEYLSYGAGVRYTGKDDLGLPVASFNSENNLKFYRKLAALMCDSSVGRDCDKEITERFAEGGALMILKPLSEAQTAEMAGMQDEYIILPLPMLDRDQYDPDDPSLGYRTSLYEVSLLSICTTAGRKRIPLITATLELMGYYSKLWVTPASLDLYTGGQYTHNEPTNRILNLVLDGFYADFGMMWTRKLLINCGGEQAGATYLTWYLRQFYDDPSDLTVRGKQGNLTLNASIKKLLNQLYEAWWAQT